MSHLADNVIYDRTVTAFDQPKAIKYTDITARVYSAGDMRVDRMISRSVSSSSRGQSSETALPTHLTRVQLSTWKPVLIDASAKLYRSTPPVSAAGHLHSPRGARSFTVAATR